MRLNKTDCETIKNTLLNKIEDGQIYLFGSRVDDSKRGGDIDLFVKTNSIVSLKEKLTLLSNLERNGILRKVDLIIDTPENHHEKIAHEAMTKGILL